jgi:hypothetical protein
MMGRRERGQGQLFYAFDLDKAVPAEHLVRQIDGVLELDWVHKELAPFDRSGAFDRLTAFSSWIGCTKSLRRTTRTQADLRSIRC